MDEQEVVIRSSRGFFGVLKVEEKKAETGQVYRLLVHGQIDHGLQFVNPRLARFPTTYFTGESGVGAVFGTTPLIAGEDRPLKVGIIGLGVGTLAAYARDEDHFRFYEIDPQVIELARSYFTYLENCRGELDLVIGDARISLENELGESGGNDYDVFVVDAFSGDSIPMHLLTVEAFELYLKHLKPTGVLAIHITNKHVDLTDPIRMIARKLKWKPLRMVSAEKDGVAYSCDWVVLTRNLPVAEALFEAKRLHAWDREEPKELLWTDDFHSLFQVLK
jgi:hypothetical protein